MSATRCRQCTTNYEKECNTVIDVKQECGFKTEDECHKVPEALCKDATKTVSAVEYDQKCRTVFNKQCSTTTSRSCSTVPQTDCKQVPTQKCSTVYGANGPEENCQTDYEQK